MKDRHILYTLGTVVVIFVLGSLFYVIKDRLAGPALVALWTVGGLGGLAALTVLVYLIKNMHRHVLAMAAAQYELEEKKDRWKIEKQERQVALFLQQNRAVPGTYLLAGDYERENIIYLPGPSYGPGSGQRLLRAPAGHQDTDRVDTSGLPTDIRYEDVRHQVPRGHILVGIGRQGIETKERAVGACTWIVGLSGTGKTSTTVLRVEERAVDNHVFLGVDPHWFKGDSLYHAVYELADKETGEVLGPGPYANRFAMPMARTPEESLQVYKAFLGEFNARKSGRRPKPWRKITLLSDEVGAQMDKATATTPEEKEIIELLPSIARICGQEARNFEMGGIFISQQATGLAWLAKVALFVIVHQLQREAEKKLATNNDPDVMREMKFWPIGRTYVFGVGFGTEGPRTVQQPYFKPGGKFDDGEKIQPGDEEYQEDEEYDDDPEDNDVMPGLQPNPARRDTGPDTGDLPLDPKLQRALDAYEQGAKGPRDLERMLPTTYYEARQLWLALKDKGLVEAD